MATTRSRLSGTKRSRANKRSSAKSSKSSIESSKSTRRGKSNKGKVLSRTRMSISKSSSRRKKQMQQEKNLSSSKEKNLPSSKEKNLPSSKEKNLPSSKEKNLSSSKEKNFSSSKEKNLPSSKEKNLPSSKATQKGRTTTISSSISRKRPRTASPGGDQAKSSVKSNGRKNKNKRISKSSDKKEDVKPKSQEGNHFGSRRLSDFIEEPDEKKRKFGKFNHYNESGRLERNATPQFEDNTPPGERVAYIHVGEGGEADLQAQQRGTENLDIEVLEEEVLPDIDERDMIHGLDHTGTARDYVDARHRCTRQCPEGCQGQLRPNEIVIYESFRFEGRLQGRKRYRGRIVRKNAGERHQEGCRHNRREDGCRHARMGEDGCRHARREVSRRNEEGCRHARSEDSIDNEEECLHSRREHSRGHEERCRHAGRVVERNGEGWSLGRSKKSERNSNHEKRVTYPEMPARTELLLSLPPVSREVQLEHAWNTNDRSLNISLMEDDSCTFQRHPVAQSTDAIRTKTSYSSGIHAWQINWPVRHRGTHAVVGVATSEASLYTVGYQSLIGINQQSWGWDLGRLKSYHDSQNTAGLNYPEGSLGQELGTVPEKFNMVLDMEAGTLAFVADGKYLGVAHGGLRGRTLFPAVSSVWGRCEITLKYLGEMEQDPTPLMYLCRRAVRRAVGPEGVEGGNLEKLKLPNIIKKYLE